ncbi:MAG TPA: sulfatase-like hydrolase/transferase [Rhizomicrobium sp.]|nr:sulfatase-like hydrolase/transferase [Rhizomicrobium sp.]
MLDRRGLLKLAASLTALGSAPGPARAGAPAKPNIIHICADDLRSDDYLVMPNLTALLRKHAVRFESHFVAFSLCAPSRVSMLTGLQAHNHGVIKDKPGYPIYRTMEDNALPVWLADAGYRVGHIGKFVNGYEDGDTLHIPPGYADWRVVASEESYTDVTLNENGTLVEYKDTYITPVLFQKLFDFIAGATGPYAAFFWPNCVHWPAIPAPEDEGTFDHVAMPLPPNFNEEDVSDKPHYVQRHRPMTTHDIHRVQMKWRRRAECLQSFDRGIAALIQMLVDNGQIANTHILFTSDNGFLEGEHRLMEEKNMLYEECARVPLYWMQPNGYNKTCSRPVSNVDATAAMVEIAGATAGRVLDGTSLVPLLGDVNAKWNKAVLIRCWQAWGVASHNYRYMEWHPRGEIELYDMTVDPWQLDNKAGLAEYAAIQASLAASLEALRGCAGASCAWKGKFPPPPGR